MVTVNMNNPYSAKAHEQSGTHFPGPEIRRPGIQPGAEVHSRQANPVAVPDIERENGKYIALALVRLHETLTRVASMAADHSKPFDEYNNQTLSPEAETQLQLLPQWEVTEKVESILITGPSTGNAIVTLQLGDRVWSLVIPATGYLFIGAPLAIYLGRDDPRILTAQTAGEYTLELMGHCDTRGNLI